MDQANYVEGIGPVMDKLNVGDGARFALAAIFRPETVFIGGINEVILRVSHEGVFTWHENADAMIEDMDQRGGQGATVAILKRLRASEKGEEHF
jgi:hypothetical protein